MYAAVAAGLYPDIAQAADRLSPKTGKTYVPIQNNVLIYDQIYAEYKILHDYFGKGENDVMKRMAKISKSAKELE
jgi:L-ribulokinase